MEDVPLTCLLHIRLYCSGAKIRIKLYNWNIQLLADMELLEPDPTTCKTSSRAHSVVDDVWACLDDTHWNDFGKKSPSEHNNDRQVHKMWKTFYNYFHCCSICLLFCFLRLHLFRLWERNDHILLILHRLYVPCNCCPDVHCQRIPDSTNLKKKSSIGQRQRLFLIGKTMALLDSFPIQFELLGSIHLEYWLCSVWLLNE